MGNSASLSEHDVQQLSLTTHMVKPDIERAFERFCALDRSNKGYISRDEFLSIPEFSSNPLSGRIADTLCAQHGHSDDEISFQDTLRAMHIFHSSGNEEQIRFLFRILNVSGTGVLTPTELANVFCLISDLPPDQVVSVTDQIFLQATGNEIGVECAPSNRRGMSYDDFYTYFGKEVLGIGKGEAPMLRFDQHNKSSRKKSSPFTPQAVLCASSRVSGAALPRGASDEGAPTSTSPRRSSITSNESPRLAALPASVGTSPRMRTLS